jgi:hypothetical protein
MIITIIYGKKYEVVHRKLPLIATYSKFSISFEGNEVFIPLRVCPFHSLSSAGSIHQCFLLAFFFQHQHVLIRTKPL